MKPRVTTGFKLTSMPGGRVLSLTRTRSTKSSEANNKQFYGDSGDSCSFFFFFSLVKAEQKKMEKRAVVLGVSKKKTKVPIKKTDRKKRICFKNVLEYLRSDSHMFALLTSPTSLVASKNHPVTREVDDGKGKGKKLREKVGEYLKSDTYMYAPLCDPQPQQYATSLKGYASYVKRVTMEIATEKLIAKDNQSTVESSNVTVEERVLEGSLCRASIEGRKKLPRKCVNDMIYHNCCSSSVSGKGICDSQPRKLLVD